MYVCGNFYLGYCSCPFVDLVEFSSLQVFMICSIDGVGYYVTVHNIAVPNLKKRFSLRDTIGGFQNSSEVFKRPSDLQEVFRGFHRSSKNR